MFKTKVFNLYNDFGMKDAGNRILVRSILERLDILSHKNVELNLQSCLLDYPATSILLDHFLYQLSNIQGEKAFIVRVDCNLPDATLLNWLFLGSSFFKIEDSKVLAKDSIKTILSNHLSKHSISLIINVTDRNNEVINSIKYNS